MEPPPGWDRGRRAVAVGNIMNPDDEATAQKRGGYSRRALIARGWTDSMIDEVLGWADFLCPNPYYPSGAQMKLYTLERVRRAETKDAFRALQAKRRRPRRARSCTDTEPAYDSAEPTGSGAT